jgi:hypothetical protein
MSNSPVNSNPGFVNGAPPLTAQALNNAFGGKVDAINGQSLNQLLISPTLQNALFLLEFGGQLSSNYTFQTSDNGKIFYVNSPNILLTVPTGLPAGWRVGISCGGTYPAVIQTQTGGFIGLSGNPTQITLGAIGPSMIDFFFNGSYLQVLSASPDIFQSYNAVIGYGAQIVTPITVVGGAQNTLTSGNNIVLDGASAGGGVPNISTSGADTNISLSINLKGNGSFILNNTFQYQGAGASPTSGSATTSPTTLTAPLGGHYFITGGTISTSVWERGSAQINLTSSETIVPVSKGDTLTISFTGTLTWEFVPF